MIERSATSFGDFSDSLNWPMNRGRKKTELLKGHPQTMRLNKAGSGIRDCGRPFRPRLVQANPTRA